jgi:hypothetical protein
MQSDLSPQAGRGEEKPAFENLERFHRYVLLDFRHQPANMARSGKVHEKPQR